mmetsp:Transcript_23409/g.35508  ORF Transcript_23409/g.35508 Transcript_23409/m.35508 type:complete len:197 (+) Transcript_23409:2109-2699(+)
MLVNHVGAVRNTLKMHEGGYDLAEALLTDVDKQWTALVKFVDAFYIKLTNRCNFPAERAWKLIGRCISAFFHEMLLFRTEVSLLEDLTHPTDKAAMVGCVLQCHRVANEFVSLDFESHPAIVQEISLFIITEQVDPDDIAKLTSKISSVSSDTTKLVTRLEKLEEDYKDLKRKHDALDNLLTQHKHAYKNYKKTRK